MSDAAAPAQTPSKAQVFLRRLITTVILWTVILAGLFSSNALIANGLFLLIIFLLALAGLAEFYGLAERRGLACFKWCGLVGGALLMVGTFLNLTGHIGTSGSPARVNDFETGFLILFVLGLCLRQLVSRNGASGMVAIATTLFGLMYVPWLLNFIQKINFFPGVRGQIFPALFRADYEVQRHGRLRRRLAHWPAQDDSAHQPRQDLGRLWRRDRIFDRWRASFLCIFSGDRMAGMNWFHAIVLGVVLSVTAVIGDLIESLFKREAGVKDSGRFFPGIGGILDLLDSLLFNAPIMYLYLRHMLTYP